jgi:ABC-2 type transport system permease protein
LRDAKGVKFRQVVVEPRVWFNPELKSGLFLVPGLMGMLLLIAAVIATSLSIVREKERETIEQIRVSPVRPLELILGKVMPYMLVCILTMALVLGLARVLFGVTVAGSFFLMVVVTLVFLFASLGLGLLISTITRSQQVAYQVAVLVSFLPSIMLSGFIFPIKNMPVLVQAVTLLVVPRYFVAALRDIMLRGASWSVIWPQLVGMLVLGILFNGRAVLNMRKDA